MNDSLLSYSRDNMWLLELMALNETIRSDNNIKRIWSICCQNGGRWPTSSLYRTLGIWRTAAIQNAALPVVGNKK